MKNKYLFFIFIIFSTTKAMDYNLKEEEELFKFLYFSKYYKEKDNKSTFDKQINIEIIKKNIYHSIIRKDKNSAVFKQIFLDHDIFDDLTNIYIDLIRNSKDNEDIYKKILIKNGNIDFFVNNIENIPNGPWEKDDLENVLEIIKKYHIQIDIDPDNFFRTLILNKEKQIKKDIKYLTDSITLIINTKTNKYIKTLYKLKEKYEELYYLVLTKNTTLSPYKIFIYRLRASSEEVDKPAIDFVDLTLKGEPTDEKFEEGLLQLIYYCPLNEERLVKIKEIATSKNIDPLNRHAVIEFLFSKAKISIEEYCQLINILKEDIKNDPQNDESLEYYEVAQIKNITKRTGNIEYFIKETDSLFKKYSTFTVASFSPLFTDTFYSNYKNWEKWYNLNKDNFIWDENKNEIIVNTPYGNALTIYLHKGEDETEDKIFVFMDGFKSTKAAAYHIIYLLKRKKIPFEDKVKFRIQDMHKESITKKLKPLITQYYPNAIFISDKDFSY